MKRFIALLMAMVMMLGLVACGNDPAPDASSNPSESVQQQTTPAETKAQPDDETEPAKQWGIEEHFVIGNMNGNINLAFSFPVHKGIREGTGMINPQPDGTTTMIDGYSLGMSPEVSSLDEIFPAYSDQMMTVFKINMGSHRYSDAQVEAAPDGTDTINGYEVVRFRGTHSYKEEGIEVSRQFIAYAFQVQANGAYAYVLVQDDSADQSQLELIESHAYNIMMSLREE